MLDSMMSTSPAAKRLQSTAARALFGIGLTADRATIAAAAAGVVAAVAFATGAPWFGIAMLLVSAALDAVDGTIARECAAASALGGVLDLCGDRLVEVAVIIGIACRRPEIHFAAFILVCSWYLNITIFLAVGAALERRGPKLIEYPPGILERSEAIIFFILLLALRPIGPVLCYLFTALEVVTGVQRLRFGIPRIREERAP